MVVALPFRTLREILIIRWPPQCPLRVPQRPTGRSYPFFLSLTRSLRLCDQPFSLSLRTESLARSLSLSSPSTSPSFSIALCTFPLSRAEALYNGGQEDICVRYGRVSRLFRLGLPILLFRFGHSAGPTAHTSDGRQSSGLAGSCISCARRRSTTVAVAFERVHPFNFARTPRIRGGRQRRSPALVALASTSRGSRSDVNTLARARDVMFGKSALATGTDARVCLFSSLSLYFRARHRLLAARILEARRIGNEPPRERGFATFHRSATLSTRD